MNSIETMEWIWSLSDGQYVFLPKQLRKDGAATWEEGTALNTHSGALGTLVFQAITDPRQVDMYFSVLRFLHPTRNIESVAPSMQLAWADLDYVPVGQSPLAHLESLSIPEPNFLWETSPGHYQALWQLDAPVETALWPSIGPFITTHIAGADKGGWGVTKVLRVPLSVNWKRGGTFGGRIVKLAETESKTSLSLLGMVPGSVSLASVVSLDVPATPTRAEWNARLRELWPMLPLSVRYALTNDVHRGPGYTRSEIIWDTLMAMVRSGISPHDAFLLVWHAPWNKYHDRPRQLWRDVQKAYNL